MIYKQKFELRGTATQINIVKEALDRIKFPFERLTFPKNGGRAIIDWANLNGRNALAGSEKYLLHVGDHPATDKDTEPLIGEVEGRRYVMGVFYPTSGNIYIDLALANYPHLAQTTVSAEVAHSVDEFLPLTDEQRMAIMRVLHNGEHCDLHTWWEKRDYGVEYYTLLGESFMALFTYAYSDMPFEGAGDFTHVATPAMAREARQIIGIERTDYTPPEPAKENPQMPTGPIVDDSPESVLPVPQYVSYGTSKIYHKPTHYPNKTNGIPVTDMAGMRECLVCFRPKKVQKRSSGKSHRSSKSGRYVKESYALENLATTQSEKFRGGRKKKEKK